jgi:hypothetical protein
MDILSNKPAIVNFNLNNATKQSSDNVENIIGLQKELFEKIITAKDEQINHLAKMIDQLLARK